MENIVALSLICFFLENTVVTAVYRASFSKLSCFFLNANFSKCKILQENQLY